MIGSFFIPFKLPSLNEMIEANRSNAYVGAKHKKQVQNDVRLFIKSARARHKLRPITAPCFIVFVWHEGNRRRDSDNIAAAKKYVLDALVAEKILIDDSRKYVVGFSDDFVDGKSFGCEVKIFDKDIFEKMRKLLTM